ncbi:MAG: hypothetical protein KDB07_08790, partial [Planctomycetes bacterium]|nr:hypothetical protein [Planctomycetota bacterium]
MTIQLLEHHDAFSPTLFVREAELAGVRLRRFNVAEGEIPSRDLAGVSALVCAGGPYAVSDAAEYPWMRRELELVKEALQLDIPVLGLGFGARVLAVALGAEEVPLEFNGQPWAEIGWGEIVVHEEA